MPGPEFWETAPGRRFLEGTLPRLTDTLKLLADQLKKVNELKEYELKATLTPMASLETPHIVNHQCGWCGQVDVHTCKEKANILRDYASDRPDGGPPAESQQERMGTEDQ